MTRRADPGRAAAPRWLRLLLLGALSLAACSQPDPGPSTTTRPTPPHVSGAPATAGEDLAEAPAAPDPAPSSGTDLPPPPATRDDLTAQLRALVEEARDAAEELQLAVHVTDERGRALVSAAADRPQLPASTLKVVTAAALLTTLGGDAELVTRVDATAGIDADGRLEGDLLLLGAGDPSLTTDEYSELVYAARPRTSLAALADQLVDAGLRELTGDVRGVADRYEDETLPAGWPERYLGSFDGRHIAGLTVDAGLRTLLDHPDARLRDPDEDDDALELDQLLDLLELDDEDRDALDLDDELDDLDPSLLRELADRDEDLVDLGDPEVRVELASDPVNHAAAELRRLLVDRDVEVAGEATVGRGQEPVVARLAAVPSPPLQELLRFTVQRSDNHLADTLFRLAGRVRTGEGTWSGGARALEQTLVRFGVDPTGAVFADGSGLSREDRLTARQLVDLDRALTGDPRFSAAWRDLQAVTGESGTLRRRLVDTTASGRFLGKTGTLRDVTALSGQVVATDAEGLAAPRYHLATLATADRVADRAVARALTDELVLALVADLDGCELRTPPDGDGPLGRAPSSVACGAD